MNINEKHILLNLCYVLCSSLVNLLTRSSSSTSLQHRSDNIFTLRSSNANNRETYEKKQTYTERKTMSFLSFVRIDFINFLFYRSRFPTNPLHLHRNINDTRNLTSINKNKKIHKKDTYSVLYNSSLTVQLIRLDLHPTTTNTAIISTLRPSKRMGERERGWNEIIIKKVPAVSIDVDIPEKT